MNVLLPSLFAVVLALIVGGCSSSDSTNPGAPADGEIERFLKANPDMAAPEEEVHVNKNVDD
jgi:hypothetical protein